MVVKLGAAEAMILSIVIHSSGSGSSIVSSSIVSSSIVSSSNVCSSSGDSSVRGSVRGSGKDSDEAVVIQC